MEYKVGWIHGILKDFGEVISGGTPKTKVTEYWGEDISWITPADLSGYSEKYIHKGKRSITHLGLKNSSAKLMPKGSVLFSSRAPIGYVAIAGRELCTNQGFKSLVPSEAVKSDFLYYYFKSIKPLAEKRASGTTFKELSGKAFADLPLCLPPLPEQRAIVSKIEQIFSELDNGISNLKLAQEQLKIYRQAVLKKAFEGNWEIVTIGDKFDFIGGGTPSKKEPKYWNGEIPWCSVKDIKGKYLHSTIDKVTNEGLKNSASNLAKVDEVILVTRISPGKAIIAKTETAINQDLKIIKPKFKSIPLFVYYLFNSLENQYVKLSSGTTVLGINLTNLKSIPIPNIPFGQQQAIVQEIETRLSVCDKIE